MTAKFDFTGVFVWTNTHYYLFTTCFVEDVTEFSTTLKAHLKSGQDWCGVPFDQCKKEDHAESVRNIIDHLGTVDHNIHDVKHWSPADNDDVPDMDLFDYSIVCSDSGVFFANLQNQWKSKVAN